jgi:hypothetical protein
MPRTTIPTTQRDLDHAFRLIEQGRTVADAALATGIAKTTLQDAVAAQRPDLLGSAAVRRRSRPLTPAPYRKGYRWGSG